jgi:transcriptional regulator with XRE-family HTH domain
MKLETYLKKNGMTDASFAAQVSLSQSQVSRIKRGISWPTRDVLERITMATGGTVTANDFLSAAPAKRSVQGETAA